MIQTARVTKYADTLATNLRTLRLSQNMTLAQLSEALRQRGVNMSFGAISLVETGKRGLQASLIPFYADALGVKVAELLPPVE